MFTSQPPENQTHDSILKWSTPLIPQQIITTTVLLTVYGYINVFVSYSINYFLFSLPAAVNRSFLTSLSLFSEKRYKIILDPAPSYPHPILPPATYLNSCPLSYPPYHILNPAHILTPAPILTPTLIIDPSHIPPLPPSYPPQLILTPPPILTVPHPTPCHLS